MSWRSALFFSVLLGATAVVALKLGRPNSSESTLPSIQNPGPRGLRALWLFLEESGVSVRSIDIPLTELSPDLKTLLITAPFARPLTPDEQESLDTWVREGGRLIYLADKSFNDADPLHAWLNLEADTEIQGRLAAGYSGGISVQVDERFFKNPLLPWTLVIERSRGIDSADATAVATGTPGGHFALRQQRGQGDIWVFANPSMFQNRWLSLGDNLNFGWALMSHGTVGFDEWHHTPDTSVAPVPWGLLLFAFQCVALGALAAWSFGTRLGPVPPPRSVERQRSILEYVDTIAWMFRKHRVEADLVRELGIRVRRLAHERAFVPRDATVDQLAELLPASTGVDASEIRALFSAVEALSKPGAVTVSPRMFWSVDQRMARLERVLRGQFR